MCTAGPTVSQVSAGYNHCIFLKSDGSLWGMGDNSSGQLGLGFSLSQTTLPVQISKSNVTAVAANGEASHFLASGGSLWAMGDNSSGELGDGTTLNDYFPEQIVSGGVTLLAGGNYFTLFCTFAATPPIPMHSLWGTGDDYYGELGDGTEGIQLAPEDILDTEIPGAVITRLSCGFSHSLCIREDGSLWATGANDSGQLGDGTTLSQDSFEEIVSNNVVAVATGDFHSLFIKSDGSLWAMGDNSYGELGDNSTINRHIPVQVATNVTAVAAAYDFSLFIKSDGSLWAMGYNGSGQLGDGTATSRYLPVLIVSSNVVSVAAGGSTSFFIKSDGSLWAMGNNYDGQLGDGTLMTRLSPVQVVPLMIPQPAIAGIRLANKNLVLSGAHGESGRTCYTLMSTSLARPLNQWTPVATNFLGTDGAFTIIATNAMVPATSRAFYVLQAQ